MKEMADVEGEGAKIRVVRCPKCEKLLPELANFSVYCCGGCGARLQAKVPVQASEASKEKSDQERVENLQELGNDSEKKGMVLNARPDADLEGDIRAELASNREASSNCRSAVQSEDRVVSKEANTSKLEGPVERRTDVRENRHIRWNEMPASDCRRTANHMGETTVEDGKHARDCQAPRNREETTPRANTTSAQPNQYPDEGPSSYPRNPIYRYHDSDCNRRHNMDGSSKVSYLEQDRVELLRMLDELRDQVKRSCEITDKHKSSTPADRLARSSSSYVHHDRANWAPEISSSLNRNPSRHAPLVNEQNMGMLNFYGNVPARNEVPGYGDPLGCRRAPIHVPNEYPQRQVDQCLYGQFDPDPILPYHHDGFYHQPACSCFHCYQRQYSVPVGVPSSTFNHHRVPCSVNNQEFYPIDGPSVCGTRISNPRVGNGPLCSLEPRAYQRANLSRNVGRPCRPIAGAAPFVTCSNCFELLQLPENTLPAKRNQFKLRCGSCSEMISVRSDGNRLVASTVAAPYHASSENFNNSHSSPSNGTQPTDEKLVLPYVFTSHDHEMIEKANGLNFSNGSEKMHGISSSSSLSGHVESPQSELSQKDVPASAEIPVEGQMLSRVSSLPLQEHFGYSLSEVINDSGNVSRSRSDQERDLSLSGKFRQSSSKDVPIATELELSPDDYPPALFSHDSWDMINKDEVQPRIAKAGDSFFAGLIKKSFRINQSVSNGKSKVSINGHPISDRQVKKAEKLAGPIYPGDYWYDYRAGFWGVMGHSCLGIIPSFIEEFNYPMPKNCAEGNTDVLVNGRELHQKDLDLLAGRGLPDTAGCSYIIDISGKVWDEYSGEELESLGKLAPTVERLKHGFGMRVPRDTA